MPFSHQDAIEQLFSMSHEERSSACSDARLDQLSPAATALDVASAQYCATETMAIKKLDFGSHGVIHLYKPCSMVKLYVSTTVPGEHYEYLVFCTKAAADAWNSTIEDMNDPRPRFAVVSNLKEATCKVIYSGYGSDGTVFATSYFPGEDPRITVYALSFQKPHKKFLAHFLVHELVHVQGARHYHAPLEDLPLRIQMPEEFGERDEFSVSAYNYPPQPPQIRKSDVDALRLAYSYNGDTYNGLKIVRHEAHPMPYHEDPNQHQRSITPLRETDMWQMLEPYQEETVCISKDSEEEREWVMVD